MAKDPHVQAEKVYREMLNLLETLSAIYSDADDAQEDDDERDDREIEDVIDAVVEEAADRGIDEETAERVFKSIAAFAKKASEG